MLHNSVVHPLLDHVCLCTPCDCKLRKRFKQRSWYQTALNRCIEMGKSGKKKKRKRKDKNICDERAQPETPEREKK